MEGVAAIEITNNVNSDVKGPDNDIDGQIQDEQSMKKERQDDQLEISVIQQRDFQILPNTNAGVLNALLKKNKFCDPIITVKVGEKEFTALIDTGAQISAVREEILESIKY